MRIGTDEEVNGRIANMSLVCACLVALSHVVWNNAAGSAGWWFVRLTRFGVCCMAVPFFFTVSGYFLARHFEEDGWWRRETVKRLTTLLVPYLFWSAAFYLFVWFGYAALHAGADSFYVGMKHPVSSLARAAGAILHDTPFLVPLWYVRALFVLVLLSPLFAFATRTTRRAALTCALLFAVYYFVSPHKNGLRSSNMDHVLYYGLSVFGAFYFCLGATLRRTGVPVAGRTAERLAGVCAFGAGVGLLVVRTWCIRQTRGEPIHLLCFIIPLLVSGLWLALPTVRWPGWLTSLSFPIYVMHFFIVYALNGFVRIHGNKHIGPMLAAACAAVACPSVAALLMRRVWPGFSAVVFGGRGGGGTIHRPSAGALLRNAAVCCWRVRWWIVLSVALCAVDAFVRQQVLWPSKALAIKVFAFYAVLFIAPVFLLGRAARVVAPVLFSLGLLIEAVQCWTAVHFHMVLSGNWVLMLFSTSRQELAEFADGLLTVGNIAAALLLLAAAGGMCVFLASSRRRWPRVSVASVWLALLFAAVACRLGVKLFNAPLSWARVSVYNGLLNLPTDTVANWKAYRNLARLSGTPPAHDLTIDGTPPLCVFIIGESTTRSHMGLYGYARDTTPGLDALRAEGGLTAFTGLTTDHSTTPEALCSLLTDGELGDGGGIHDVFPTLLKTAGYRTALISCQGHWQAKDIVGTYLFHACDETKFLQGDKVPGTLPDEVALPEVRRALRENDAPFALFVHLYGCHHPAAKRVPPTFRRTWPPVAGRTEKERRKIDAYDTAVAYDDQIVASIIREVAALRRPSCVFFVSDHGESPDSRLWRDVKSRDVYEIPLCIWLSPEYRAAFPDIAARVAAAQDAPLRQRSLMEGMLDLARVRGYPAGGDGGSFLSPPAPRP